MHSLRAISWQAARRIGASRWQGILSQSSHTEDAIRQQPAFYSNINECFAYAWQKLEAAPKMRGNPFRTPVFATCDERGVPHQRVMVLQDVECTGIGDKRITALPRLRFHSDRRTPKCAQLMVRPECSALFYDRAAKVQLRVSGTAEVRLLTQCADDGSALEAWQNLNPSSRRCYFVEDAPSAVTTLERMNALETSMLSADVADPDNTSPQFTCLILHVREVEFLYLAHTGSRRALAQYKLGRDGNLHTWLVP